MMTALRDLVIGDLDEVLQINQGARPGVGDLDMARLQALVSWCAHARVALRADRVVGYLLALEPGQPYASENYRYFEHTMTEQVYVDRIAVAESHRGQGIGAALYQDLFERRPDRAICCEVNVVPMNAPSLRFHERLGFEPVGEQQTEGGDKRVRLLVRAG
jgi:predicted GNAT superfamily acetyltransferase